MFPAPSILSWPPTVRVSPGEVAKMRSVPLLSSLIVPWPIPVEERVTFPVNCKSTPLPKLMIPLFTMEPAPENAPTETEMVRTVELARFSVSYRSSVSRPAPKLASIVTTEWTSALPPSIWTSASALFGAPPGVQRASLLQLPAPPFQVETLDVEIPGATVRKRG